VAKKKKVIKKKVSSKADSISFEDSLEELTAIVARLEEGQLGLDASLQEYEQGVKHLKQCHQLLSNAERKIQLLKGVDADGNPIVEPFDDGVDATLEEKAESRGRRRSAKKSSDESGLFD